MKILAHKNTTSDNRTDHVITSMEKPRRFGLTLLVLVFGVFGVWATLAPLDGAAYGPGTVTVRSYKKIVQHLEGGIVAEIMARDGDLVEEGEPLLVLDDTQSKASLQIATSQLIALRTKEARLIAERNYLDTVTYPDSLQRSDSRVRQEIAAQNEIFEARKASNQGRREILEQRVTQLRNQIAGMQALRESKELLAASYKEELRDTQSLLDQGFSEKTRLRDVERNFASFSGQAAELTANIAATEVQMGEAQLQILQLDSEFLNEVVAELSEVQTSIQDIDERVTAIQDVVDRTTVVSPDSGYVNGMRVHTIGGVIAPGFPIAEIVPESDELIIEASINPNDIDRVSEGQEARIRFSAFGSSAPTIFGTVITLSADSVLDENTGMSYYRALVQVNKESTEGLGELALLPGMPAEVFINTGSRTMLQYLFKPFSNAISRSFNED